MRPVIILHHHEIVLKGENRGFFEKSLTRNLRTLLGGLLTPDRIAPGYGRTLIATDRADEEQRREILRRLTHAFGIAKINAGFETAQSIEEVEEAAGRLLDGRSFRTLRVETRRPDKRFPLRSMEVNARVGGYLCTRFGVRADLTTPDETIQISLIDGKAFVYRLESNGAGGLPGGTAGRVVSLLSSGFDSPVATWQVMKRGAHAVLVHFHSMPYTSRHSVDQVRQIAAVLARYQLQIKLYTVPFAGTQQDIVLRSPQPLRVVLYRRMMIRVAEALARKEHAEALVTGEAVGQVASQTLRNIRVIDEAARYPILRPVAGSDKEEIMALAQRIGTYEISKEPYDDCCSFLAPRNPETWAEISDVLAAETAYDPAALAEKSASEAECETFRFPPEQEAVAGHEADGGSGEASQ